MGLLDIWRGQWPGLLDTPIDRVSPLGRAAPMFVPQTEPINGNDRHYLTDPTGSYVGNNLGFAYPNQTRAALSAVSTNSIAPQRENSKALLEDPPVHLAQFWALPPVSIFARPPIIPPELTPLEQLPAGSAGGSGAGRLFPRSFGKQDSEGVPCTYCGKPTLRSPKPRPDRLNGDHVIPRNQGGNNSQENRVPACQDCNLRKGGRTPTQWYDSIEQEGT
jgi:hypothetical protein